MSSLDWPRPLRGDGPLRGNRWVKHIYADESGTSRKEPMAFVATVIVDPDIHLRRLAEEIRRAEIEMIPEAEQDNFYFHAKDVYGKYKKQFGWDINYCNKVVERWLKIVYDFDLCPTIGWWPKEYDENGKATEASNKLSHMMAFAIAMSTADGIISALYPNEIASVYAEDVPEMRAELQRIFAKMRAGNVPDIQGIRKIENTMQGVSFLKKDESIFLQLADAVAFSFMRTYHRRAGSERLYSSFWGKPLMRAGPEMKSNGSFGRFFIPPIDCDEARLSAILNARFGSVYLTPNS